MRPAVIPNQTDTASSVRPSVRVRQLFPWLDRIALRQVVLVAALALALRLVLFVIDPTPLFTTDSSTYLWTSRSFELPYVRPVGTGYFYRMVLFVINDLRALVAAQAGLGVLTTALAYLLARETGIRGRSAVVAAMVVSVAPSTLLFERTMHGETLAVFLTALTLLLVSVALRSERPLSWLWVGLAAVGAYFVRTAMLSLLLSALVVLVLWWKVPRKRRLVASLVLIGGFVGPTLVYASAMAYQTRDLSGGPYFGVTHFDGASIYPLVADATDCDEPSRPPPLRAALCTGPPAPEGDPLAVIWAGPVQEAVVRLDWPPVNAELRQLAIEAIVRDPWDYVVQAFRGIPALFGPHDLGHLLTYAANPADVGLGEFVSGSFPRTYDFPGPGSVSPYSHALSSWYRFRWVLGIGVLGATLCALFTKKDTPPTARLVILYPLVSVTMLCLVTITSPRIGYPLELASVLASAWMIDLLHQGAAKRWSRTDGTG